MDGIIRISEARARVEHKLGRELGPQITALLDEQAIEDICLNPDGRLWVKRRGQGFACVGRMSRSQAESAIGTVAALQGTTINHDRPILETELPIDGSRFEALVAPVVSAPTFAIRRRAAAVFGLADYESSGILSNHRVCAEWSRPALRHFHERVRDRSHREVLIEAVQERLNILVVGATGAGKTTLVNALLAEIAQRTPHDRTVLIEDTIELNCTIDNHVALRSTAQISMLQCLRATMRLKPTRIIVGEVRGAEALTLLKAWNTGHPGGVCTVHANDAHAGLMRLESLINEATPAPQQALIAEAVDLVVFIDEDSLHPAGRVVREVAVVTGYSNGSYQFSYV